MVFVDIHRSNTSTTKHHDNKHSDKMTEKSKSIKLNAKSSFSCFCHHENISFSAVSTVQFRSMSCLYCNNNIQITCFGMPRTVFTLTHCSVPYDSMGTAAGEAE